MSHVMQRQDLMNAKLLKLVSKLKAFNLEICL